MANNQSIAVYLTRVKAGDDKQKLLKAISDEISSKSFTAQDLNDWQEGINLGLKVANEIIAKYMI